MSRATVKRHLTVGQARLLSCHRQGLERAAVELAWRNAIRPIDIMFVLADRKGRIGRTLAKALPVTSIGPVVLPGRARELEAWVEHLALYGPLWEFSDGSTGIPVVVIDSDDLMAVLRFAGHGARPR